MQVGIKGKYIVPVVLLGFVPVMAIVTSASYATIVWLLFFYVLTLFSIAYLYNSDSPETDSLDHAELYSAMNGLIEELENNLEDTTGHLDDERQQIGSLIEDAVVTLQHSFSRLNQESLTQNNKIEELLQGITEIKGNSSDQIEQISEAKKQIGSLTSDAIRALQFEDLVSQLAVSSSQRLEYLTEMLNLAHDGLRDLESSTLPPADYIAGLDKLRCKVKDQYQKNQKQMNKSIAQESMDEGETVFW